MSFSPPQQEKLIRKEKIYRLCFAFFLLIILIEIAGLVFLIPSYLLLSFSKDDVLRRLKATEEILTYRNLRPVEEKIGYVNTLLEKHNSANTKRKNISVVLIKIANSLPENVKLNSMELKKGGNGSFALLLRGKAARRDFLLAYIEKLKTVSEIADIESPITNLLKEEEVEFSLTVKIKPETYSYAN